jgi:hypothetical protein
MKKYLISYDLVRGGDYPDLIQALRSDGARRILYSEWLVFSTLSASQVRDRYNAYLDLNDRIFVCEVSGDWASRNLMDNETAVAMLRAA